MTTFTNVSFLTQYLIALIGLGVAVDYSLLMVTRWREERARGAGNDSAVIAAMSTAGRAIAFSGVTVAVGLAALIVLPVRSCAASGMAESSSRWAPSASR